VAIAFLLTATVIMATFRSILIDRRRAPGVCRYLISPFG